MATVVEFEQKITADDQREASDGAIGAGRISIYKSACPDLVAATQAAPGWTDNRDYIERILPIGSKLQFLVDNVTSEQVDVLYVLPNGKAWSQKKCSGEAGGGKGFLGSWAIVGIAGLVFYYLFTRKK